MRNQTLIIFIISFLIGCAAQKTSRPLEKLDFKNHNWQIVYTNHASSDTLESLPDIWLLNDNHIVDSLKNEYNCKINQQGDGEKEYIIYFFKDKTYSDWQIFNDKKNYNLGSLQSKFTPVNASYYYFSNWFQTKTFVDSLERQNVVYTISPIGKEKVKKDDYGITINLFINPKSKLLKGKDVGFYDSREYTKEELAKLYPEFYNSNMSFVDKEEEPEWLPGAPGDRIGGKGNFYYIRNEQKIYISLNKPFIFDTARFHQTDLFSRFEICTQYTVAIYRKK